MNAQDLRNHVAKSVGFGVETPRTADPNERNETGADPHVFVPCSTSPSLNCERCGFSREYHWRHGWINKAVQVCSAGDWPEDHGGNFDPSRREANFAFSDWLDSQQGDSLPLPASFSDWIASNNDSIIE